MNNFNSLRELLIKKAKDDVILQTIISVIKDELLADKLLESLEKMARPQSSMGRSANAAITAFGKQMTNKDVEQMRDALAHHVNHHKSAVKHGNREAADEHLKQIVKQMHLAGRTAAHSDGQLGLDYIPMEPWETNYTTPKRIKAEDIKPGGRGVPGKLKEGTKGLRRELNSTLRPSQEEIEAAAAKGNEAKGVRSVPDYRYLEMAPHEEHADSKKSPHKGGYPFEEIQLGNPAKVDAKEAYLHLQDVGPQEKFVEHPFDKHPINKLKYNRHKQDSVSPKQLQEFIDEMQNWHGSEHNAKWMQGIKDLHAKDPEAFKARGKVKPGHHFEGIPLLQQPHAGKKPMVDTASLPPELASKHGAAAPAAQPAVESKPVVATATPAIPTMDQVRAMRGVKK